MPWISIAASIGGSLISGAMSGDAAGDAAAAQGQASAGQIAEARRQYDLTRSDQAQFRGTGIAANKRLSTLLGLGTEQANGVTVPGTLVREYNADGTDYFRDTRTGKKYETSLVGLEQHRADAASAPPMSSGQPGEEFGSLLRKFSDADLQADPVYQSGLKFGLDQGAGAINARAIAGGGYDSGATLKALTKFGNDYGSTKANESYNRYNTTNDSIYNKLAGVSGAGQQATNQVQSAGQNMANQVSGSMADAGNARAAGIVGGANAWNSAMGGVSGALNNYSSQQTLNSLLKNRGGYGNASSNPYGNWMDWGD